MPTRGPTRALRKQQQPLHSTSSSYVCARHQLLPLKHTGGTTLILAEKLKKTEQKPHPISACYTFFHFEFNLISFRRVSFVFLCFLFCLALPTTSTEKKNFRNAARFCLCSPHKCTHTYLGQ